MKWTNNIFSPKALLKLITPLRLLSVHLKYVFGRTLFITLDLSWRTCCLNSSLNVLNSLVSSVWRSPSWIKYRAIVYQSRSLKNHLSNLQIWFFCFAVSENPFGFIRAFSR